MSRVPCDRVTMGANEPKLEISNYVKLNIGGSLFYTTVTTLSKLNSKLRDMVLSEAAQNAKTLESEGNCRSMSDYY